MRVGAALKRRRKELGLTQQDVATKAGLSVRTVGKIEQGQAGRHSKSVEQLARILRLDLPADATSPRIQVCLLGPLVVRLGGQAQELGAQKQRSLLGLLALHNGSTVGQDEIVETLWGHHPPATWHNLIHTYVARLRKALGTNTILTGPRGYRLSLQQEELDLAQFGALIKPVNGIPPTVDSLAMALDCWRGPLLAGLPGELRQHPVAVAVAQRRVTTALTYSDMVIGVESGPQDEAVRRLQLVIIEEPLHEGLIARLMLLLAASGRQAEAISRFIDIRDRLRAELGIDPNKELQQAHQRVLGQRGPWSGAQPAPRVSPAQLPAEVTGFTGRSRYLDELDELHMTTRSTQW